MNNYTDTQLKQALAKMLPSGLLRWAKHYSAYGVESLYLEWANEARLVEDTELLHLCWLVGKDVEAKRYSDYLMHAIQDEICTGAVEARYATANATWQQRVIALAKVKGIEIV